MKNLIKWERYCYYTRFLNIVFRFIFLLEDPEIGICVYAINIELINERTCELQSIKFWTF